MHNVNNAKPPEKQQKANKAKVPSDNHAKPLRKSKKNKKSKVFRRMQVGAYIWHFRMRFCFFSSGDDVFKSVCIAGVLVLALYLTILIDGLKICWKSPGES